jgi:hypothetical protein
MIRGIFLSKAGILLSILSIFVIIPTALSEFGIEHAFVDFFVNPFVSFTVIVFIGFVATYNWLRPHWISLIHVAAILGGAFVYVYVLLM